MTWSKSKTSAALRYKRHSVSHQAADEMHVAAQPVQLRDGDGATLTASFIECSSKLRAAVDEEDEWSEPVRV